MRRILSLLLVLTVILTLVFTQSPAAAAPDDKTAGIDITFDDITDFYYTYDASTAPPHYQRYRFFSENGKHYFYHETREGGGWPQTEADISRSGTAELTDSQWTAFCNLLYGGTASRREEYSDSGDAGPWLYIYWRGGEPEGREFSFDQPGSVLAFERFCAALADHPGEHTLTRFFYLVWSEVMPQSWEITLRKDGYWIRENEETPRPFPETLAAELLQVIADNGADSWQGEYEPEYDVLDGEGFSLEMVFADGVSVQARGNNAFPDKYFSFKSAVLDILQREKTAIPAGIYPYGGEDFDSDSAMGREAE